MVGRRIGQEDLVARREARGGASLDRMAVLIDWTEIDGALSGISAASEGEAGWPPLALFRALLLATWHDLSDVRLAEALDDRGSFRRFCGFAAHEPTPEGTAFVRFRRELVRRGLDRVLFETVTRQLSAHGPWPAPARWWMRRCCPRPASSTTARPAGLGIAAAPTHGYKAHVATD